MQNKTSKYFPLEIFRLYGIHGSGLRRTTDGEAVGQSSCFNFCHLERYKYNLYMYMVVLFKVTVA